MTKKKKPAKTVSVESVEQIDPTPQDDVPSRQVEEVSIEQPTEPEPVAEVEPTPSVEVVIKPELPAKPKPLTLVSLHSAIEELRKIVDQQGILIKQLMETPVRQRKPPTSNGKVSIKDIITGKIYPSKNNVYQSLLKAGELEDLVKQGVFGSDPAKNSFGCYNLFRAYPNRFVEVHDPEQSV